MPARTKRKISLDYLIIGNSAAGISAAREIRRCDPAGRITIISEEPTFGYSRVLLPLYIAGKISKRQMLIAPRIFYATLRIRLLRGETVESLDPRDQRVRTGSGLSLPYDRLLIATGSSPRKLDIPGKDLQGIHYFRKMTDAEAIKAQLSSSPDPVLVVGGGLVGVKSLEAVLLRKKKVHLVISSDRILSQMLDKTASDFFLGAMERSRVRVHFHNDVKAFCGKKHLEGALLSDGTALSCGLAIIGKGIYPNVEPLKGTGIAMNQGVIVDSHMNTSLPFVYAAGDVAELFDVIQRKNSGNPIWPLAVEGGRIAGANMASVPTVFSGALRMNCVEVLGTRVVSAGQWEGEQEVKAMRQQGSIYRKLVFSEGRLIGFVLAGDIRGAGVLTSLIRNQTKVAISALEEGLERGFSYWPRLQALGGFIQPLKEEGRPT